MLPKSSTNVKALRRCAPSLALPMALAATLAPRAAEATSEFSIANIFFELNSTAGDLGVHVSLDGENWKALTIKDPRGRPIVDLEPEGSAARIGLSELFFEGSEPPLVDVSFAQFLRLFPPGDYVFSGKSTGNQLIRNTDPLTAELACPVKVVSPPTDRKVAPDKVVIRWQAVPGAFNPDTGICRKNRDVGLASYEVIAEIANEAKGFVRHYTVELPAGATEVPVPREFIEEGLRLNGTEFKLEVIAIEDSGNKTITEGTFQVEAP
jgi:hypothetical protein